MSLEISPEHQDFVRAELESGHFANERELIAEALELLRSRQRVLEKLKSGIEQLARGEGAEYGPDDRQRFVFDILRGGTPAKEPPA